MRGTGGIIAAGCRANFEKAAQFEDAKNGNEHLYAVVNSHMRAHGVVARGGFGVIPALGRNLIFSGRGQIVSWYHGSINYIIRIQFFPGEQAFGGAPAWGTSPNRPMPAGMRAPGRRSETLGSKLLTTDKLKES